jgi:hypothetical protein
MKVVCFKSNRPSFHAALYIGPLAVRWGRPVDGARHAVAFCVDLGDRRLLNSRWLVRGTPRVWPKDRAAA